MLAAALFLPLPAQAVSAQKAILWDAGTERVLYEKDADSRSLIASTTKIMTALIVCEQCNVLDRMRIPKEAVGIEGSSMYLREGEVLTVQELLYGLMLRSGNDAAVALAIYCGGTVEGFVALMNDKAHDLGMKNSHFVNPNGLDAPEHYSTARDIAVMSAALLHYPGVTDYSTVWMDSLRDGATQLVNTNKLVRFYNGATGLKTGFTSSAMYCLSASAQREDMELIAVIMGSPSSGARFSGCKQLLDYGFAGYGVYTPSLPREAEVPVRLGKVRTVAASLKAEPILVEKAKRASITTEFTLEQELPAPVEAGQRIGTLKVLSGEEVLAELPLTAAEPVEKVTWWDMFLRLLRYITMSAPE